MTIQKKVFYHLPGLFECFELYAIFLPLYHKHRSYFYDWCEIGSIYGAPADCIWNGGRVGGGASDPKMVKAFMAEYGISARLTFSNSQLNERHLKDDRGNHLCRLFEKSDGVQNGVIVHADVLSDYLAQNYPELYQVSSTTKVLTNFEDLKAELDREIFRYVVPDFRLNRDFEHLKTLSDRQKRKVEFLSNECCWFGCQDRKRCYDTVSLRNLGIAVPEHRCAAPESEQGYRFSKAMTSPGFIGIEEIQKTYAPMGFSEFKIEGRGLGSALILEFLLYYMTRPEDQLKVREAIYLDNMLDLF